MPKTFLNWTEATPTQAGLYLMSSRTNRGAQRISAVELEWVDAHWVFPRLSDAPKVLAQVGYPIFGHWRKLYSHPPVRDERNCLQWSGPYHKPKMGRQS